MRLIVARVKSFEAGQPVYGFRIDHTDDADLHLFMMSDEPFETDLPVELTNFGVDKQEELKTRLNWETATEINSDYFNVQHSTNGIDYNSIAKVVAAGESKEKKMYEFVHTSPAKGDNYYRLKIMDQDNTYEYSRIIHTEVDLLKDNVAIFPNPSTNGEISVQLKEAENRTKNNYNYVRVFNQLGRLIYQKQTANSIIRMNLAEESSGVYMLVIGNNKGLSSTHQIVLR